MDLNGAIRYLSKKHLVFQGDGCACQMPAKEGCAGSRAALLPSASLAGEQTGRLQEGAKQLSRKEEHWGTNVLPPQGGPGLNSYHSYPVQLLWG